MIAIQLYGNTIVKYEQGFSLQTHSCTKEHIGVIPKDLPHQGRVIGDAAWLAIHLEDNFITHALQETLSPDRIEILPKAQKNDLLIQQIGLCLLSEINPGTQYGQLYAESLATTLAIHIIKNYSASMPIIPELQGGLPQRKLREAIDYIQANLDRDIKLADIAATLGISQYYFSRLFRQSMGLSPYQYVIYQRVERAKVLLKNEPQKTLSNIAIECGFTHQSHLTNIFHQFTGTTPKAYRRG